MTSIKSSIDDAVCCAFSVESFMNSEVGETLATFILPLIERVINCQVSSVKVEDLAEAAPPLTELHSALAELIARLFDYSLINTDNSSNTNSSRNTNSNSSNINFDDIENACYFCFNSCTSVHQFSWAQ